MQLTRDNLATLLKPIHGWCSAEKSEWLAEWIAANNPRRIVEIGVFGGRSLLVMGLALKQQADDGSCRNGYALGIDPYDPTYAIEEDLDPANREWWNTVDMEPIYQGALALLCKHEVTKFAGIVRSSAEQIAKLFPHESLDLVHVDGCHSETASCRDVKTWFPLLRHGGVMVLDDTDWPSVRAAKELLDKYGVLILNGGTWCVYERSNPWEPATAQSVFFRGNTGGK